MLVAERDGKRLVVDMDEDPQSPREWGVLGTMVCLHRGYELGDEQAQNTDAYDGWDGWLAGEVLSKYVKDEVVYLPLFLLDHSGITMRAGSAEFRACDPQGWDWGQVGWIWATKDKFREETGYNEEELFKQGKAEELLRGEVAVYDSYLRGEVYCFALSETKVCESCGHKSQEVIDSCCGFYGDTALDDIKGAVADDSLFDALEEE